MTVSEDLKKYHESVVQLMQLRKQNTDEFCSIIDTNLDILFYKVKGHKNCDKQRLIIKSINPEGLLCNEKVLVKLLNSRRIYSSGTHFKTALLLTVLLSLLVYNPFNPNFDVGITIASQLYHTIPPFIFLFVVYMVLECSSYTLYRLPPEFNSN